MQRLRCIALVILDLVALIEHAESPTTVFEPACFGRVGFIGRNDKIWMSAGELVLEARAFAGGAVEAKGGEGRKPAGDLLLALDAVSDTQYTSIREDWRRDSRSSKSRAH